MQPVVDEGNPLAGQLRQAREARGKTLEQVHQQTGISLYVLRSLEAGEFAVVEPVYIRLALRAYAENLGLNATCMVRQFAAIGYPPPPLPLTASPPPRFSWARLWTSWR